MCKVEPHSHAVIETCLQWLYSVYLQDAFVKIVRGEGVTALWSGLPPTLWVRRLLCLIYSLAALYPACCPFNDKLLMWLADSCWPCSWCTQEGRVHSKSPISGKPGQIGQFTKIVLMLFILVITFLTLNGLLIIKLTFVNSLVLFLWLTFFALVGKFEGNIFYGYFPYVQFAVSWQSQLQWSTSHATTSCVQHWGSGWETMLRRLLLWLELLLEVNWLFTLANLFLSLPLIPTH